MKLKISETLKLPLDVTTQALAFLGRRGSGKSYAATKLAELLYSVGAQFVAIDPVGVWWGLRLGADGKSDGLDIPIFGGLHGDIPLEVTGGALLADVIIDREVSAVLDVSQFESDADKARFARDFAARFFFRKKAAPSAVHLFIEESQEFIPQNIQRGEEQMLHAFQRMIRLGRNYGIGVSMITQRPQDVNKKALNQAECLFCFQLTGPQERKAVEGWASDKGLSDDLSRLLPELKEGHAHVWSPVWLGINEEVHIAQKETFAAGSTPKVGQKPVTTKPLAPLELEKIRTDMAATVEKAKANDPANLKKRIAELERQLAQRPKEQVEKTVEKIVEVPVLKNGQLDRTEKIAGRLEDVIGKVTSEVAELRRLIAPAAAPRPAPRAAAVATARVERVAAARVAPAAATPRARESHDALLGKAERRILTALAQYPDGRLKKQVAVLTGYAIGGGGFNNAIGALRSRGYVEGSDPLRITQAGSDALGEYAPLPHGQELLDYWRAQLAKAEREILDVLAAFHPDSLTKEQLAAETPSQYAPEGGGFNNAVGRLRTLELVHGKRDALKASDDLFG